MTGPGKLKSGAGLALRMTGALIVTFSIIAFSEIARPARLINVALGAWLIAAPWLLSGVPSNLALANSVLAGLALIAAILLQQRGTGLGGAFGGEVTAYRSRRGIERTLFRLTIVLAVLFVLFSLLNLVDFSAL